MTFRSSSESTATLIPVTRRLKGVAMVVRVKVSNKHQIAVPAAVRKKLHIKSGDQLLLDVRDGSVVLMPEPRDYSQHLHGLHQEIWTDVEPQEYVRQEREAWQA